MGIKITTRELSQYQPLNSLTPENIREIASKLNVLEFKNGDSLFKQGDTSNDQLYLFKGTVEFFEGKNPVKKLEAGSSDAQTALGHIIPRTMSAVAQDDVVILKVNGDLLDMMLTWDQTGNFQVEDLNGAAEGEDWMSRLLQTEAFHRIPPSNIQAIFTSLEDILVKPGDAIIKQGEPGDYFYIVKSGRCMVTRRMPGQENDIKLADLKVGDSFGEEALISDSTRNATVVMLSEGILSRLSKEQFLELLNEPLLDRIEYAAAREKVQNGEAKWLDIRLPAEHDSAHIKGDEHVPLIFLRMKADNMDKDIHYILYCDTGRRSSSASFLLNERGFTTYVLKGGMKDIPSEDMEGSNIPG